LFTVLDRLRLPVLGLLILGILFASGLDILTRLRTWNPTNLTDDPVTNWEKRIEPLRNELPTHGEIGYLADWDLPGWDGSQSDMDNEYRLTQYALAPTLLLRGAGYPQIVANLTDPKDVDRLEKRFGVKMVHSYGLGIYLFEGPEQ
jgi:hypothetical protein